MSPAVVAIGGGHGLSMTLQAVRRYAGQVTAVVSVADDGGSSGRLREEIDIPAPGDVRRCLSALANPDSVLGRAFEYRFPGGDMGGHALGNLVIAGLADATGDFVSALDEAGRLLGITGRVLPATAVPVVLKAEVSGHQILGQVAVGHAQGRISKVSPVPVDAPAPPEVIEAIRSADQVVLGPGSLYTSVLAACTVDDIRRALAARRGGRVYVCNLHTEPGETVGFSAGDHLRALEDHGIAVDVMVVDPHGNLRPDGKDACGHAARSVAASLIRADGQAHDPVRLAKVLQALLP